MYGRPTSAAPTARWTGASSRSTTSEVSAASIGTAIVRPVNAWTMLPPAGTERAAASAWGPSG